VKGKSRSERARGQEQKTTWWVVGGAITGSSLISIQNRLNVLSFKLARTQSQLKSRKGLRGSMGEQRGSMREHGGAMREQGRAVREHGGATREHTDETGVSARAEQRRLSQQLVTCWPEFGDTIYIYINGVPLYRTYGNINTRIRSC